MLSSALSVLGRLEHGESVILYGSASGAPVAQIASLVQLCADPYYRTVTGFAVLVEKEWAQYGIVYFDSFWPGYSEPPQQNAHRLSMGSEAGKEC